MRGGRRCAAPGRWTGCPSALTLLALAPVTLTLIVLASPAAAQSHYWSDHFGNESLLLNGAVIGSVTDAGAVFYNPARLIQQSNGDLLAGAKVFEWSRTTVRDGRAYEDDLESSRFGGVPSFVVGSFTIPGLDDHSFAYGILTRHRDQFGYALRTEDGAGLPVVPPADLFVGFVDYENELRDNWIGLSWARTLSRGMSFGASLFYYDRHITRHASVDFRGASNDGGGGTLQVARDYRIQDLGLVGKAGVSWRQGRATLGLSLTLPYWSFSSKGSVDFDDFALGLPDSTGVPGSDLRSLRQDGLSTDWRTPWSVGFGAGWETGKWQLHSAVEYFASIPFHTVLQTDTTGAIFREGQPIRYSIVDERNAVVNVGAGVRWTGSDRISLFGSVATNLSAAPDSLVDFAALDTLVTQTTHEADFFLVGGGISVRTPWVDLTLGATWQAGSDDVGSFLPGEDRGAQEGPIVEVDQWRVLFGFSVPLIDDLVGGVTGGGRSASSSSAPPPRPPHPYP